MSQLHDIIEIISTHYFPFGIGSSVPQLTFQNILQKLYSYDNDEVLPGALKILQCHPQDT
jgi:hypothetical protein